MMAKFVYIYTGGGMPETEEEGARVMKAWQDFLGGIGDKLVDQGNPFGASQAVNGNGALKASGYSVVTAGSLDEAVTMAKGCPIFDRGGNVEVYEAIEM
jgi:hypothetical protein